MYIINMLLQTCLYTYILDLLYMSQATNTYTHTHTPHPPTVYKNIFLFSVWTVLSLSEERERELCLLNIIPFPISACVSLILFYKCQTVSCKHNLHLFLNTSVCILKNMDILLYIISTVIKIRTLTVLQDYYVTYRPYTNFANCLTNSSPLGSTKTKDRIFSPAGLQSRVPLHFQLS